MTRLAHVLALVGLLCGILVSVPVAARDLSPRSLHDMRLEAVKRRESGRNRATNARRAIHHPAQGVKNITFTNPKASGAYAGIFASLIPSLTRFQSST
jgi:hypothetical protein